MLTLSVRIFVSLKKESRPKEFLCFVWWSEIYSVSLQTYIKRTVPLTHEQQKRYVIKSTEVKGIGPDGKPRKEYVALIVPRIHPLVDEIVNRFDEEIQMFNDNKPND